jgi:hypothetical protein
MMEGVAARLLCWQRGLTGWNETRQLVYSHTGESQERGRAGPQVSAGATSQRRGLLASEASWTINRDKLKHLLAQRDNAIDAVQALQSTVDTIATMTQRLAFMEERLLDMQASLEELRQQRVNANR